MRWEMIEYDDVLQIYVNCILTSYYEMYANYIIRDLLMWTYCSVRISLYVTVGICEDMQQSYE